MLKLNLLPPEEKRRLVAEENRRWVNVYGSALIGAALLFLLLLVTVSFYISIQLNSMSAALTSFQKGLEGQDLKEQEEIVKNLNLQLEQTSALVKNHKYYSSLLISLAKLVPLGVQIQTIDINDKNETALSGFAPTRDQVILFKEALENSPLLRNLENPISNLVKQNNINFNFKFFLQNDALIE